MSSSSANTATKACSTAIAHRIRHTFMHFKQVKRVLARAAELIASDWGEAEPEHLVVLGETGVGKSTILEQILRKNPRTHHATFTEVPVLYVEVPARCTIGRLCAALLQALGSPFWNKGDDGDRQDALVALMKKCKVRLVIIDEINHLIERGKQRTHYALADWVKQMGKLGGASLLLAGTPRAALLLKTNEQLGDRFAEVITLRPLSAEGDAKELRAALKVFGRMLGGLDSFDIAAAAQTKTFGFATGGRLRAIRRLLIRAVQIACRPTKPALTWDVMGQAFLEVIYPEAPATRNPFSPKFDGKPLAGRGEPFAPREE